MQPNTGHCIGSLELTCKWNRLLCKRARVDAVCLLSGGIYWMPIVRDGLFFHRRELGYARLSPCSSSSITKQNISKTPSTAFFERDRPSVGQQELVIPMAVGVTSFLTKAQQLRTSQAQFRSKWADLVWPIYVFQQTSGTTETLKTLTIPSYHFYRKDRILMNKRHISLVSELLCYL